jgi:hypothetical protein
MRGLLLVTLPTGIHFERTWQRRMFASFAASRNNALHALPLARWQTAR